MQKLATSSGLKSTDSQITLLESTVTAVQLVAAGAAATLIVYEGTSSSGLAVATISAAAGTSNSVTFNKPVVCNTGVFADVSGAGATYIVHFIPGT
jgi:hypothetical protein